MAIGPIDGRYRDKAEVLAAFFSERALIQNRIIVMTEYMSALSEHPDVPLRAFTHNEKRFIRSLQSLSLHNAKVIKAIETKGYGKHRATNHDVKACELWLREQLAQTSLADVLEWIHFGATSEDVNNIAYALMLRSTILKVLVPALEEVSRILGALAKINARLTMLARTHGQPATPTTFGKEFNVFVCRLDRQIAQAREHHLCVKWNSASGNYNALVAALPDVQWIKFTEEFVERLNKRHGTNFEVNLVTTQIEPHDSYAELFDIVKRANSILIDFCQDTWRYISDDWLVQKATEGEAGSSIMPHKVNPIDFENAEGNLEVANGLFESFSRKLPRSRLQRDLSDSTVERNFGVAFGHCLVAYKSILKGLGKVSVNKGVVTGQLDMHPEVITEAFQTVLRSINYPEAYNALKNLSRGKKLTLGDLHAFVGSLNVSDEVKARMRAITPANYVGLAPVLAVF